SDFYFAKLDPAGNFLWLKNRDNVPSQSMENRGTAIVVDNSGYGFVAASFKSWIYLNGIQFTNQGYESCFVAKFDPSGIVSSGGLISSSAGPTMQPQVRDLAL